MKNAVAAKPTRNRAPAKPVFPALPAYAQAVIDDPATIIFLWWARSCLKTTTVALRVVIERLTGRVSRDCIYTTVNEENGAEFLRAVKRCLDLAGHVSKIVWGQEQIDGLLCRVGYVEFPRTKDGARPVVKYISGNPTAFRGLRGDLVFDEVGFVDDVDALLVAAAGCASLGATLIMMTSGITEGSPADQIMEMGLRRKGVEGAGGAGGEGAGGEGAGEPRPDDMPVSLHTCTIDRAIEEGVVEYLCHVTPLKMTREQWRAHCRVFYRTEQQWLEETGCVKRAVTDSQYFPFALTRPCCDDKVPMPSMDRAQFMADVRTSVERVKPDALFAGVDVAKTGDLFVVWVLGRAGSLLHTLGVLFFPTEVLKEMNREKRTFDTFKALLTDLMRADFAFTEERGRGNTVRVSRVCIDRTGLGENLAENMEFQFRSRAEGVIFSATTKPEFFQLAHDRLADRRCTLPSDPAVLVDFASVKQIRTASGAVRYDAERNEGSHADRACAFALAVHAVETRASKFIPLRLAGGCRA
ncbi:MAG: hypothetical protein ACKVZJ_10340 [Phycisphaerales bacterium]